MPSTPRLGHRAFQALISVVATVGLLFCAAPAWATTGGTAKTDCAYTNNSISTLSSFDSLVNQNISCVQLFVDSTTTWQQWETPWIDTDTIPDNNWNAWFKTPGTNRQVVITQGLIPSGIANTDWLDAGAAGDYEGYAQTFAQNLVAAGFGGAIIRLAPEANGDWNDDSLGTTPTQWAEWDQFWNDTVIAMRSVPGAHFQFDWCINALYRNLPLSQIYPGNNTVQIIGIDAYDSGNLGTTGAARWNAMLNNADGIQSVLNLAKASHKPISIPEWGVEPPSANGGGDDAAYVNGIASVVANNPVAYQSYFYKYGAQTQLQQGPQSLTAYQNDFLAGS
jgi:hypothetical protein